MKAKTHFSFDIDLWDAEGINIVDHLAGLDDFLMAMAAYDVAVSAKPKERITLRQGARIVKKSWQDNS
jgi:hypothetical protein